MSGFRRSRIGAICALIHVLLVAVAAVGIMRATESDWPMAWTIFLFLDFPVSLLLFPLTLLDGILPSHLETVSAPVGDMWNFLVPVAFFGVAGTGWWYWVGGWAERRRANQRDA